MARGVRAAIVAAFGVGLLGAAETAIANGYLPSGDPIVGPRPSSPPSSGSAPSPEVDALLGILVVGGTVAFIRRRRKGGEA